MKKVALVFVVAVIAPSLVLAWLAVRSLRDQQFVLERQQSLLYQNVTDALARDTQNAIINHQHAFASQVEALLAETDAPALARTFDERLRRNWPLAEVGFVVAFGGEMISPAPSTTRRAEALAFSVANGSFLGNRETAEVYSSDNVRLGGQNTFGQNTSSSQASEPQITARDGRMAPVPVQTQIPAASPQAMNMEAMDANLNSAVRNQTATAGANNFGGANTTLNANHTLNLNNTLELKKATQYKSAPTRSVVPQQVSQAGSTKSKEIFEEKPALNAPTTSKVVPTETEFQQLIGDASEGTLARFVNNKLSVLFWYRSPRNPRYIFGAQLSLPRALEEMRALVNKMEEPLREEICVALLDDNARPAALSHGDFRGNWKHPFVSTEVGQELPHWEVAAYLLNPAQLTESARTLKLTLGLLIALLVLAIGVGSWLIVNDLRLQLRLARQKTDFVSNVSHELKTPLTSIRMFSELLADGRVTDPARQRSYLSIITAEAARLTRLINNVLDFSRLERGEKKYNFQECDLAKVVRETAETYRPHLENNGFKLDCSLPEQGPRVRGDCDALAQIIVNLLSNAEKYSDGRKEITVELARCDGPLPCAEVRVLDRGLGVPRGSEEKIFEKFYRAHDSLSSGIQGSGLGLTLARQIARAHGGDVVYEARSEGGSCFCLRLPVISNHG